MSQFEATIESRVPRVLPDGRLANPTPLLDITESMLGAAKDEYGLDMTSKKIKVYGKFESKILGGSIKTRPAVQIIREAIASGALTQIGRAHV